MILAKLYVYPLKSAAGIRVPAWPLDDFGLRQDRRFMLVDENGEFMTQREFPQLALVRTALSDDALVLSHGALPDLRVPLEPQEGTPVRTRVWDDEVDAVDLGDDLAAWTSRAAGVGCRLLHMPSSSLRQVDRTYARDGDRVGFADAFPLLLLGDGSVAELERRSGLAMTERRFRPNLYIAGVAPHAEDSWKHIRVGDIDIDVVKPCARCAITTVEPDSGERGKEPLRTLNTYRLRNGKVYFAQNAIHRARGVLREGAAVNVLETREPVLAVG